MGRNDNIKNVSKNYVKDLKSMSSATKELEHSIKTVSKKIDELNNKKVTIKLDATNSINTLSVVQKEIKETATDIDRFNRKKIQPKIGSNPETVNGTVNSASDSYNNEIQQGKKELYGALGKMLGGAALNGLGTRFGSAFGEEAGIMFSSVASGAIDGIMAGLPLAVATGGLSVIIGAGAGILTGIIDGSNKIYEKEDDYFKTYYKDQYTRLNSDLNNSLINGSLVAGVEEQQMVALSNLLGGKEEAKRTKMQIDFLAAKTPYEQGELLNLYSSLINMGYEKENIPYFISKIGDASAALGWGKEENAQVVTTLGRMESSGTVTAQDIAVLEKYVDVWGYLNKETGKTKDEILDLIVEGNELGKDYTNKIMDGIQTDFKGNMLELNSTFPERMKNLTEAKNEMDSAMGEGYNKTRNLGIEKELEWYNGPDSDGIRDIYEKIGEAKAHEENIKEQFKRDVFNYVTKGKESELITNPMQKEELNKLREQYNKAKDDVERFSAEGKEKEAQKARLAENNALLQMNQIVENEYTASDVNQMRVESEKKLVEYMRTNAVLNEAYYMTGYHFGEEFTKGMEAGKANILFLGKKRASYIPDWYVDALQGDGKAYGLSYVPYNGFPAILHEGERVLTASENRAYGKGASVNVTGNTFVVREEADINKVARAIARQLSTAVALAV